MRRATMLIGLASLALSSCHTYDRRVCCPQPAPATCTFKSVKTLNHADALVKIQGYGFTNHPKCYDGAAHLLPHDSTWAILPAYKDWIVATEPPEGDYGCGTVLDLTFVPPPDKKLPPGPK